MSSGTKLNYLQQRYFFSKIPIAQLAIFRVGFGLLLFLEAVGAVLTGWVSTAMIQPQINFSFIPFYPWLQPLPGEGMVYYYLLMGVLGLLVMVGLWYKPAMLGYFIMWTIAYWMQKSHYNNHYYLISILTGIAVFMPANRFFSLDVKYGLVKERQWTEAWTATILVGLLLIVYTAASLAKIQPDWLEGKPLQIWFSAKAHYWLLGPILQERTLHLLLAFGGILFDGLIIPALLFKPTRKPAIAFALMFHIFNSIVFQIGIFPYLMLFMSVFFFPPQRVHNFFFRASTLREPPVSESRYSKLTVAGVVLFFAVMVWLPIRHHLYEGDVNWTESGHRMAWRMMLRHKEGRANFEIVMPDGQRQWHNPAGMLTPKQLGILGTKPDVVWQYAQYLKEEYRKRGEEVEIYAHVSASLNGRPMQPLVDSSVNLANEPWRYFTTQSWIVHHENIGF